MSHFKLASMEHKRDISDTTNNDTINDESYDNLFRTEPKKKEGFEAVRGTRKFEFNQEVAQVFDNMLQRSIPFYKEQQSLISELILEEIKSGLKIRLEGNTSKQPNSRDSIKDGLQDLWIYDLGCSTGNFLFSFKNSAEELLPNLMEKLRMGISDPLTIHLTGLDKSPSMIEQAQRKKETELSQEKNRKEKSTPIKFNINFKQADILNYFSAPIKEGIDFFILNYTLQFIDPHLKTPFIKNLYERLNQDGLLILSEKVLETDPGLTQAFDTLHQNFKRSNNYSELEIARKRSALEKVLIPQQVKEHFSQLQDVGFEKISLLFKVANFVVIAAKK